MRFSLVRYRPLAGVLLLILLSTLNLDGQGLIYEAYGIREGLSNRLVQDVITDDRGLVWIATGNGLNRFDGYGFLAFYDNQGIAADKRLSHSHVADISRMADGRLLLAYNNTYYTFDIFDPLSHRVEKVEVGTQVEGEPRLLYVDARGELFAVTRSDKFTTIYAFDPTSQQFTETVRLLETWEGKHPNLTLFVDEERRFFLHDEEHGLRSCLAGGDELLYCVQTLGEASLKGGQVAIFDQDLNDRFWLSFSNYPGVYQLSADRDSLALFPRLATDKIYADVWEDLRGNLIFNQAEIRGNYPLSRALTCLSIEGKTIDFSHLLEVGNYVLDIHGKDFFRSLFIGTDTGLKLVQNTANRLQNYLRQQLKQDQRGYSMRGMCKDEEGHVYFAREVSAWYRLDPATGLLDTIRLHDKFGNFLDFNDCQGIWYDPAGYLWGVTGDGTNRKVGYLHHYDIANCTNEIIEYPDAFTAYSMIDQDQFLLGARSNEGQGSLLFFDRTSGAFTTFYDRDGRNPFQNVHIRYILPLEEELWIGSEQGLFRIDRSDNSVRHYVHSLDPDFEASDKVKLGDNTVYVLYRDCKNILWVGTENGLTSYSPDTDTWETYTTEDGLVDNTIANILPGEGDAMWVSTYNGLSYFTPKRDDSRNFFAIDGLTHNEFNRFSAIRSDDGRYYFGGVNGVNVFYPDELLVSRDIPRVLFTSFSHVDNKVDSTITVSANLENNTQIVIEPHYAYFRFDFSLPIYTATASNQFRYRVGNDPQKDWIYLNDDRSLRYNDLKAGNYNVYVQGSDPNGNWGKESLVVNVLVREVFYKRTWFMILMSLVLLGFLYGLLRYRLEEKLRMERLRTQLASDLHDEVSGLLAGISLQSELLRSQINEPVIDEKLNNIRKASQRAMSKMSDVIWSIDSRRDRLSELIGRMEEHADEVLLPIGVRYQLKTDQQLQTDAPIPANIRQNVYFIYKEAINNVAKHANAQKVDIWMGNRGNDFELWVKDDGKGLDKPTDGTTKKYKTGQGLANLRMRAQRLNAEISIENGQGFTIHLKMKKFI